MLHAVINDAILCLPLCNSQHLKLNLFITNKGLVSYITLHGQKYLDTQSTHKYVFFEHPIPD